MIRGTFVPTLAFGWKCGLDEKPRQAKEFYLVMAACMLVALAIDYLGVNTMKALSTTAVINGFLSAPLLAGTMLVSNDSKIIGNHTNSLSSWMGNDYGDVDRRSSPGVDLV